MFLQNDVYYIAIGMKIQEDRQADKWKKIQSNQTISRVLFSKMMDLVGEALREVDQPAISQPDIRQPSRQPSARQLKQQPSEINTINMIRATQSDINKPVEHSPPEPPNSLANLVDNEAEAIISIPQTDAKCQEQIFMEQTEKSSRRKSQRPHTRVIQATDSYKDSAEQFRSIFFNRLKSCALSSVPAEMKAKQEMRGYLNMICDGSGVKSLISMKKFQKFMESQTTVDSQKAAKSILMQNIKKVISDKLFWQEKIRNLKDTRLTMTKISRYLKSAQERVSAMSGNTQMENTKSVGKSSKKRSNK